MCASRTHLPLVRAIDSRTCQLFRPTSRPYGTKPAEVRAHLPRFPGISHAHPPASRRFPAAGSRTSPCFPAADQISGQKPAQVREQLAGRRRMCATGTHFPSSPAIALAENCRMCAARTHIPSSPTIPMARDGRMCASETRRFVQVSLFVISQGIAMASSDARDASHALKVRRGSREQLPEKRATERVALLRQPSPTC
jgi:hypothetical protein